MLIRPMKLPAASCRVLRRRRIKQLGPNAVHPALGIKYYGNTKDSNHQRSYILRPSSSWLPAGLSNFTFLNAASTILTIMGMTPPPSSRTICCIETNHSDGRFTRHGLFVVAGRNRSHFDLRHDHCLPVFLRINLLRQKYKRCF